MLAIAVAIVEVSMSLLYTCISSCASTALSSRSSKS